MENGLSANTTQEDSELKCVTFDTEAQSSDPKVMRMFEQITKQNNVFYKSQQLGEADLTYGDKIEVLRNLFRERPTIFLERYHRLIGSEFLDLFDNEGPLFAFYSSVIALQEKTTFNGRNINVRNCRYAEMLRLREAGVYFSNEKMRERDPLLFDMMVGKYLSDNEKLHLRPTVEVNLTNGAESSKFTNLLQQLDETQRISDRRRRHLDDIYNGWKPSFTDHFLHHVDDRNAEASEEEDKFEMEFDSSDDEGREAELDRQKHYAALRRQRNCAKNEIPLMKQQRKEQNNVKDDDDTDIVDEKLSGMRVSRKEATNEPTATDEQEEEWSSGDEDDNFVTGISREQLRDEFVSIMEQRFLNGDDDKFFNYSALDGSDWSDKTLNKIRDQDIEDAYFDAE